MQPAKPTPPSSPDDVKGNEERSLTRPANFRRALAVLERKRQAVEGVYDGLRVAPGRIDTTVETKNRRMHLQVRTDFKIGFSSDSEFPNRARLPPLRHNRKGRGRARPRPDPRAHRRRP